MGAHCEDVCPEGKIFSNHQIFFLFHRIFFSHSFEGFYGKHCMDFCSCPSPQFVCHAAHGCVCRIGYIGTDCLTPKGQYQELHNGNLSN